MATCHGIARATDFMCVSPWSMQASTREAYGALHHIEDNAALIMHSPAGGGLVAAPVVAATSQTYANCTRARCTRAQRV
jgi:hypothetical protein